MQRSAEAQECCAGTKTIAVAEEQSRERSPDKDDSSRGKIASHPMEVLPAVDDNNNHCLMVPKVAS